jgi:hypothetical protein
MGDGMTRKEKLLIAKFLDLAADEFGNHGCNDVEKSIWDGWTIAERRKFVKEYYEYNGEPEEYDPDNLHLPDFCIMDYGAAKLRGEA